MFSWWVENDIGVSFTDLDLYIMRRNYIRKYNDETSICVDEYIPAAIVLGSRRHKRNNSSAKHNIIVVRLLFSTLLTYNSHCVVTSTNTQNSAKCGHVSLTVCVIVSLNVPVWSWTKAGVVAYTLVGLGVHFLWLNSISWMNVCCYHMLLYVHYHILKQRFI